MRIFGLPSSKVLKKAVQLVTGFGGQLVFHLPEVFKDWIRFHTRSLPSVLEVCKLSVISSPAGWPPLRAAAESGRSPGDGCSMSANNPSSLLRQWRHERRRLGRGPGAPRWPKALAPTSLLQERQLSRVQAAGPNLNAVLHDVAPGWKLRAVPALDALGKRRGHQHGPCVRRDEAAKFALIRIGHSVRQGGCVREVFSYGFHCF